MFPMRYELDSYILLRINSISKGLKECFNYERFAFNRVNPKQLYIPFLRRLIRVYSFPDVSHCFHLV
jgi:hypothetical protein